MAHINHIRMLDHMKRLSIEDAIDHSFHTNFAAFCGSPYQRNRIGMYETSAFCGNIGIVLLHNDPQIDLTLQQIYELRPDLTRHSSNFRMVIANQTNYNNSIESYYDPFYGLGETAILDALAPIRPDMRSTGEVQLLRSILSDYLSIMDYQFRKFSNDRSNPSPFGDYPYNLDLLLELTRMPYQTLFNSVLKFLPSGLRDELAGRLSAEGSQSKAYYAVFSFASVLRSFLWTERGFAQHSRISIISEVRNRNLISIRIADPKADILDYIALELQQLNNAQTPYLLLESGIDLNNSPKLKRFFLADHGMLPYYTGILADNISSVISQNDNNSELSELFSQTQEIFVFSCSSIMAAQPFSDGIGNYYRQLEDQHTDYHHGPFQFFGSHSYGNVQREVAQRTINPEELTSLGTGCLLCGRNYPIPVLVDRFQID